MDPNGGILIYFHVGAHTGYAMRSNERAFLRAAERLAPPERVHLAFTDLANGVPTTCENVLQLDPRSVDYEHLAFIRDYVRTHMIRFALGYDQPPGRASIRALRAGGVRRVVSYWGAPMSSIFHGPRLWANRVRYQLTKGRADAYVFESHAMARRATHGRGIPASRVHVAAPGVDEQLYRPARRDPTLLRALGVPDGRAVIFYAGHMEPRKGVGVLMEAANALATARDDFHFLIFGNKNGEEKPYLAMLSAGRDYVTFGGYRDDVLEIMPQCYIGVIASTGWDSFPATALEMAACGLPLVVSDLDGLPETIQEGSTGYATPAGDALALAARIAELLDSPALRQRMSHAARQRIVEGFTLEHQTRALLRAWDLSSC